MSTAENSDKFYEAVLVRYDTSKVDLYRLIEIHLKTHQSKSNHSMRDRYLSAVYTMNEMQHDNVEMILQKINKEQSNQIITKAYKFGKFKCSRNEIQNYYKTDPERPFCKTYIQPKLDKLSNMNLI